MPTAWDMHGRALKDVVLESDMANELEISEMQLNLDRFSAIDQAGVEHFVLDFIGQKSLRIPSLQTGANIRTRSIVKLPHGVYTTLRFYIKPFGNRFIYSDRHEEPVTDFDYVEFKIQGGLRLSTDEPAEMILRFDFPMYAEGELSYQVRQLFTKLRQLPMRFRRRQLGTFH